MFKNPDLYMKKRTNAKFLKSNQTFNKTDKSLCSLNNSQFICKTLDVVIDRASSMF